MDGATLKTLTEDIMDDNIDDTLFYQILNTVKGVLEEERPWEYLKKLDPALLSITSGQTASTSRALPADFGRPYRLFLIDGSSNENLLQGVPFEEQHLWTTNHGFFWLDLANDVLYLSGTQTKDATLYHYYLKFTPDIAAGTEPVFPDRFHSVLAFRVASYLMGGVDADNLYTVMTEKNAEQARMVESSMRKWDDQLKLQAMNGSLTVRKPNFNNNDPTRLDNAY